MRTLWSRLLVVAVAAAACWFLLPAVGIHVHPVVVPLALAVAVLGGGALADEKIAPPSFVVRTPEPVPPLLRDRRLSQLTWLMHSIREGETWDRRMVPLLAELVEDRLAARHGIVVAEDPEAARAVLDPQLWALVTGEARPPRSTKALAAVVERIHAL